MTNWIEFKKQNPDMEDFFLSTFTSINDFNIKFKHERFTFNSKQ